MSESPLSDGAAPSFRDLPPGELGGVVARRGLDFQDHVAAGLCLDMLLPNGPREVWCETQDDVLLFWEHADCVEYVQAKSTAVQRWTVAEITRRNKTRVGTSLVERSLLRDRAAETAKFRVVTTDPVDKKLKPLTWPLNSSHRATLGEELAELTTTLIDRLGPDCISERDHGLDYWTDNCHWDVQHSQAALHNRNLLRVIKYAEQSAFVTADQAEEIYARLVRLVYDAALADYRVEPEAKVITRDRLATWLLAEVTQSHGSWRTGPSKPLTDKLATTGMSDAEVGEATRLRNRYRVERLEPRYVDPRNFASFEAEIESRLRVVRSRLDTGLIPDDGAHVHQASLEAVESAMAVLRLDEVPLHVGHGIVYELTARCVHRFRRAGR